MRKANHGFAAEAPASAAFQPIPQKQNHMHLHHTTWIKAGWLSAFFLWWGCVFASPPDWPAPNPAEYDYSATFTGVILLDGGISNHGADQIALAHEGTILGVGTSALVGSSRYHFVTIYSHVPFGIELDIWVYSGAADEVYVATTTVNFVHQLPNGSPEAPVEIETYADGDAPVALQGIPGQTVLQGGAFESISLSAFLVQADEDPILWSISASHPGLEATLLGDVLSVVPQPDFFGPAAITVRATEATANAYFAEAQIAFTVQEGYAPPVFDEVPWQYTAPGSAFPPLNLLDYEDSFGGECLALGVMPVLETPDPALPQPAWIGLVAGLQHSATVSARVSYTPGLYFSHPDDRLAFFIDGDLRGVAGPGYVNGEAYYLVTVRHSEPEAEMEARFYSAAHQDIYTLPVTLPFGGSGQLGSADAPLLLDFSPFLISVGEDGQVAIEPQAEDFRGGGYFTFTAADCAYPGMLADEVTTSVCYDVDSDADGLCDDLDPFPLDPCAPDYDPPPLTVRNSSNQLLSHMGSQFEAVDDGFCGANLAFAVYSQEDCTPPTVSVSIDSEPGALGTSAYNLTLVDAESGLYALELFVVPGSNELTVTSEDPYGNQSKFQYTIVVADEEGPQLVCQTVAISLDGNGEAVLSPEQVFDAANSTDNCGILGLQVSQAAFSCADLGSHQVTLTAEDPFGNAGSCTATVLVVDEIAPLLSCTDFAISLNSQGQGSVLSSSLVGNVSDNCTAYTLSPQSVSFSCADAGVNPIVVTATDGSGNATTCTANVTVTDPIAPQIFCRASITRSLDASGSYALQVSDLLTGSSDNCSGLSYTLSQAGFDCTDAESSTTVTLTAEDPAGNTGQCTAQVSIIDDTAPQALCQDITVYLGLEDGLAEITPLLIDNGTTDNCPAGLQLSASQVVFNCDDLGLQPVTLTATDPSGNSSSCEAAVMVLTGEGVPSGWSTADIGTSAAGTTYSYDICENNGTYSISTPAVNGSFGSQDQMGTLGLEICNTNFQVSARIATVSSPSAYGGITARESTAPGARSIGLFTNLSPTMRWEQRTVANTNKQVALVTGNAPSALLLQRTGNFFRSYYRPANTPNYFIARQAFVSMPVCMRVSLSAFSLNQNPATATFDEVDFPAAFGGGGGNEMAALQGGSPQAVQWAGHGAELFPNPAFGRALVRWDTPLEEEGEIRLYNPAGQLLQSQAIAPGATRYELQLKGLPTGLYYVSLQLESHQLPQTMPLNVIAVD